MPRQFGLRHLFLTVTLAALVFAQLARTEYAIWLFPADILAAGWLADLFAQPQKNRQAAS